MMDKPINITVGDEDKINYESPPPLNGAETLFVSIRLNVDKVSEVSTVDETGRFTGTLVITWTDRRFIGWPSISLPPPAKTWGPWMRLANSVTAGDDEDLTQVEFEVLNCETGRMKRGIRVDAVVGFPMALDDFPFDLATFTLRFMNLSHFRSKDLSQFGSSSGSRGYRLVEVPDDDSEGRFSKLNWNGEVREWEILGFSYEIDEKPPTAAGSQVTIVPFRVHLGRKYHFYVWKTMVPNFMIAIFAFLTPFFPMDNTADRINYMATLILSTLALLFVVGDSLPKLDKPTLIDKCMFVTMSAEILLALSSVVVVHNYNNGREVGANSFELWTSLTFLAGYICVNVFFCARVAVTRKSNVNHNLAIGCTPMLELQEKSRQEFRKKFKIK